MAWDSDILVGVTFEDIRGGVRRAPDGTLRVAVWRAGSARMMREEPVAGMRPAMLAGLRWRLVGGVHPANARSIEVADDAGRWHPANMAEGAWAGFLPGTITRPGLPPVRFRARDGTILPTVSIEDLRRSPPLSKHLSETHGARRCPVCGSDDWRAWTTLLAGATEIVCGGCGYTDGAVHGVWRAEISG